MADVSVFTDAVALSKGLFDIVRYVKSVIGAEVISAYFRFDGTRVEGSAKITIEREISENNDDKAIWYYRATPVTDYVFIRYPLIESCSHEVVGTIVGEKQPTAEYWHNMDNQRGNHA